jgi:hypothetical protein
MGEPVDPVWAIGPVDGGRVALGGWQLDIRPSATGLIVVQAPKRASEIPPNGHVTLSRPTGGRHPV